MLLSRLIDPLPEKRIVGTVDPEIEQIAYDSRRVVPGTLFACIRGSRFDGHNFIPDALKNGASAILADRAVSTSPDGSAVPTVLVPEVRKALPVLANRFYGYPSRHLKLVGITGTNGKTTTTYLVESMLRAAGVPAGVIGTLGARIKGTPAPTERTTPESVDLQKLLSQMVQEGVRAVAMEVSSHALAMHRTEGCEFDVGVFTNLTQDHLDFHSSIEDYLQTKMLLFREYPQSSSKTFIAVVNLDDPYGEEVARSTHGKVITYGISSEADVRATNVNATAEGISFRAATPVGNFDLSLKLGGLFNVYNSLAAIGAGIALGLGMGEIKSGLSSVSPVAGRFEAVGQGKDFGVIVDYAHTPDGLENVLKSARFLTTGRLIVVFGCGGDRDKAKRPIMGRIASELADFCIVTSDNPRSEPPEQIAEEIIAGIDRSKAGQVKVVLDRREAIRQALETARSGDLVVVAGKGHETYQIFKDKTIPFDDREVVRELLGCLDSKDD